MIDIDALVAFLSKSKMVLCPGCRSGRACPCHGEEMHVLCLVSVLWLFVA